MTSLSACALVLTGTVGISRLPKPALLLVQGFALLPVLGLGKYLAFLGMADSHTLGLAGGAVALLVGALGFPRLVRRGGAPDSLALTGQAVAAPHVRPWFARSLRRAIAARKPGPLLLHTLGPTAHAAFLAMPLVGGLAVGAVIGLLLGVSLSSFWMRAGVVACILATPLLGGSGADMPRVLAAACLGLVGGALILRPYAAARTQGTMVALVRVVWILLSALVGFGALRDDFGAVAWAAFAAAAVFPAGRLA